MKFEFWFEFASTYTYPTAMRVEAAARAANVSVVYRPFLLGPIFASQGWNDSPFNIYPAKGKYMWRDLERICASLPVPFTKPTVFPRNGLLAARVACAGQDEPWGPAFVRGVYTANFAEDCDIGNPDVLAGILGAVGADAASVLLRAGSADVKQALRLQTERAQSLGIFGSPSFVVGDGELFWGNDRLEAALSWVPDVGSPGRR